MSMTVPKRPVPRKPDLPPITASVKKYLAGIGARASRRNKPALPKMTKPAKDYMAAIGSLGGKASKRKITPEQQRRMQEAKQAKRTQKTA